MSGAGARQRNPWIALTVLSVGLFMTLLDLTIVNVAIPRILTGLNASLDEVLWVQNAYILVLAVLLITAGRLGDIFGPRTLFMVGTALFTVSSLACGLAQDAGLLIAARAVQGLGAALMTPQPLALILSLFPPERRGAAFGVNGIVAGVATAAGPVLGGLLVEHFGWRWIFYVNVPIGIAALICTLWLVPDVRPGRKHRFDLAGVGLISVGLLAISFGLVEGQRYAWGQVWSFVSIPLLFVVGAVFVAAFLWVQRRRQSGGREPLVPFALFRDRNFALMNIVGPAVSVGIFGLMLPVTIYLQSVLGIDPLTAGLVFAPSALVGMVVAPIAGRLADRHGGKYLLMGGLALYATTTAILIPLTGPDASTWPIVVVTAIGGIGIGCVFVPMIHLAMEGIAPPLAGAASGVLNTSRQIGSVLGSAAAGALLQNRLAASLHDEAVTRAGELPAHVRDGVVAGFSDAAKGGLEVGAGQSGGHVAAPPGSSPALVERVAHVATEIFDHAFTTAMHWTLLIPVVVLGGTAVLCALVQRRRPAAGQEAAAPPAASSAEPVAS